MQQRLSFYLKYAATLGLIILARLIPFRAPNVEPILAAQMPIAKRGGVLASFVFGLLSIVLYDLITGTGGSWSWATALTYAFLGPIAVLYFRNRQSTGRNYVVFAFWSTIIYDAVTGVVFGPLMFHQSLQAAFFGQIPFTLLHLAGNLILAAAVSPLLYRWLTAEEPALQTTKTVRA